ncbi:MAG: tRNA (adenosine(37)-N6)-threonylcarbamoyltransferase complex ATPase subunit type 1 TsaE [Demequinaceae bacterium]|nr:tRNA (adenosine(37)-N6)-threonylcarbamoyltransferase complex ATPase subunit type 1 TsaE [Demequinaceae bacterium]
MVLLPDADATRALGRRLAGFLRAGDLVLVVGELGAGKTTFAQGVGEGLGVEGTIASPTFIIARVHRAPAGRPSLVHVDAYRLTSLAELDDLDLDESIGDAVTVVEWGEGLAEVLADSCLTVTLDRGRGADLGPEADARRGTVRGRGPRWDGVDLAPLLQSVDADS